MIKKKCIPASRGDVEGVDVGGWGVDKCERKKMNLKGH